MAARKVTITLTSNIVAHYEARSYPDDDRNNDGMLELYTVPVYEVLIDGTDDTGAATTYRVRALDAAGRTGPWSSAVTGTTP